MKMKCMIIDDEPLARKGMEEYANDIEFLDVVSICDNALQANTYLKENSVDLVLLDIQMPKLSGLDFLKSLKEPPVVIITTAYQEYALEGYELNVTDYLVKPIAFSRFLKAVNKAKDFLLLKQKETTAEPTTYFFLKVDNRFEKINYEEILFIEALQNYVAIYTASKKMLSYITFTQVEKQLPPDKFMKVHKSYIVAIDKIKNVEGNIINIDQHQVPVSRGLKEEVMQKIVFDKLIKR
ncbi:MAG: LytTR family DNA-binding domain-containing protein [Panacibacter sp.]